MCRFALCPLVLAVAFAVLPARHVGAEIVLSNFNSGSGGNAQINLTPTMWSATPFTVANLDVVLNSIVAEARATPTTPFMDIYSTDAGGTPDAVVGSLDSSVVSSGQTTTFTGSIALNAGTSYFAVVGVANGGSSARARVNASGDPAVDFGVDMGTWTLSTNGFTPPRTFSSSNFGASWVSDGASSGPLRMQIDATSVPEPSMFLTSLLLLGGVFGYRALPLLKSRVAAKGYLEASSPHGHRDERPTKTRRRREEYLQHGS